MCAWFCFDFQQLLFSKAPLLLANASSPDQANPIVFDDIW
jgi:hypothetical protein